MPQGSGRADQGGQNPVYRSRGRLVCGLETPKLTLRTSRAPSPRPPIANTKIRDLYWFKVACFWPISRSVGVPGGWDLGYRWRARCGSAGVPHPFRQEFRTRTAS